VRLDCTLYASSFSEIWLSLDNLKVSSDSLLHVSEVRNSEGARIWLLPWVSKRWDVIWRTLVTPKPSATISLFFFLRILGVAWRNGSYSAQIGVLWLNDLSFLSPPIRCCLALSLNPNYSLQFPWCLLGTWGTWRWRSIWLEAAYLSLGSRFHISVAVFIRLCCSSSSSSFLCCINIHCSQCNVEFTSRKI